MMRKQLWDLVEEWDVSLDEEEKILGNTPPLARVQLWLKMEGRRDCARQLRYLLNHTSETEEIE